jgi:hypothetical protein
MQGRTAVFVDVMVTEYFLREPVMSVCSKNKENRWHCSYLTEARNLV